MSTSSDSSTSSDVTSSEPKKNEQLDNVINKLKNQCSSLNMQKNSTGPESISSPKEIDENSTNFKEYVSKDKCTADQSTSFAIRTTDDKYLNKNYLTWENSTNLCWLDASMSLLVHNKTLCHSLPKDSSTQTAKILMSYKKAISIFNDHSNDKSIEERLQNAKDILKSIQESVLAYLKPFLKCDDGKPDSAFCSLLNLISKDREVKEKFNVRYAWHCNCKKCLFSTVRNFEKPIITFNEVKHFIPNSPVSLWKCSKCLAHKQEMYLKYKTLPQCLIFHFENGAGKGEFNAEKFDFEVNGRKYKLSGLMTLHKGFVLFMNHFVTWIRDVITGYWLECNDLNSNVSSFTISQPTISLEEVLILAYEAIDNDGTIFLNDDLGDVTVDNNEDYLLIDLADESEDDANNKIDKTDADKLKQSSSRSGKKNCNKSENISADYVNNKTSQFTDLNVAKESTSSLENEENIIKGDILQKRDSLASMDSFLEFVDRENNEISLKVIDDLLKCIEKNVEKVNPTPLLDSLTCQSSVISKNNVEYNAIKESLKENMDDIFKTGSKNCSVEKKIFPLNVSENVTGETVHKNADGTCFLQNEPLCETTEIQVKKSDLISQREIKIGFEIQHVPENSATKFTGEIKPITKHSKPISSTQEHTICMGNTGNSKNKKYFFTTRSKRKKSIDNSALETIPKSGNTASKPPKNFSRQTNPIMHTIKTAHNSSTPNAITNGENKFSPEPNETKHNIKSDGLETKTSETMSMDGCKNYDSSLKRTSKIEEETLKNEILKKTCEQTRYMCNSNLDALMENLKGENVKSDFANTKRKILRKTNTYESLTLNRDFVSSYPVNNKRCKISESTDNYNSVSEKTYNKSTVLKTDMPNENLCEVSSSKRLKKTSIPTLKTIPGNISKKICPPFDMLNLCEQKRKAECLIPAQTKRGNKNLDVDLHSVSLQFPAKNKMVPKKDTISNLTAFKFSVPSANYAMETNSDKTKGSLTVFAPSVNRNHDQIFLITSNFYKFSKSLEVVDKKAVSDRSEKSSFNKHVKELCARNLCPKPQMNNSNETNIKCEKHQNNMDLNLHSVQAQHHTNNGTEIEDEEAVKDRIKKLMHKASERTLAVMFNFLNLECN